MSEYTPYLIASAPLVAVCRDEVEFAELVSRICRLFNGKSADFAKAWFRANDTEACEAVTFAFLGGPRPRPESGEDGATDRYLDPAVAVSAVLCAATALPTYWMLIEPAVTALDMVDAAHLDDGITDLTDSFLTGVLGEVGITAASLAEYTNMPSITNDQMMYKAMSSKLDGGFDQSKLPTNW